jgi:hypothetical protein
MTPVPSVSLRRDGPDVLLWVEMPRRAMRNGESLRGFLSKLLQFIRQNRVVIKVSQLVLRILSPRTRVSRTSIYQNPSTSLIYTELLQHLPSDVEVRMYPYLGKGSSENYQKVWAEYMGEPEHRYLTAVYRFAQEWNDALALLGCPVRFNGVTVDMEEGIRLDKDELMEIKGRFLELPYFGISVGFDDVRWVKTYHDVVDHYYLQLYDFYYRGTKDICLHVDTSPFVHHKNEPIHMYDWLQDRIVNELSDVKRLFSGKYKSQLYLLWSTQHAGSNDCLYPLHGRCGHSYDFGTWSPESFHEFLVHASSDTSAFSGFAGHGIYEFAFVQNNWYLA